MRYVKIHFIRDSIKTVHVLPQSVLHAALEHVEETILQVKHENPHAHSISIGGNTMKMKLLLSKIKNILQHGE